MMSWIFGILLLAYFVSMPRFGPALLRTFLSPATFPKAAALAGILVLYGLLFFVLAGGLLAALSGRPIHRPHITNAGTLPVVIGVLYLFVLLLLLPVVYLGGAGRRAAMRYATDHHLPFDVDGGEWKTPTSPEPWALQNKIARTAGGFIATAVSRITNTSGHRAYTLWTVGSLPGASCTTPGAVVNGDKYIRKANRDEEPFKIAGVEFLLPRDGARAWSERLARATQAAPALVPELVYLSCDDGRLTAACSRVLRSPEEYEAFDRLLGAVSLAR